MNNTPHKSNINKTGWRLFLVILLVYLVTASGRIDSGDGQAFFDVSYSLLEEQDVALPPPDPNRIAYDIEGRPLGKSEDLGIEDGYRSRGRNGNYYSPTGIGQSLLLLPLLALGKLIALFTQSSSPLWVMEFTAALFYNPLVSAAGGLLLYLTARRLSFSSVASVSLAIIYAFGTMTWVYAKSFYSDPLVTLLLLLAFYGLVSYRYTRCQGWLWLGGAALGFAILVKPTSLINAPLLVAYLGFILVQSRFKKLVPMTGSPFRPHPSVIVNREVLMALVAFGLPVTLGLGLSLAYNWWRFGSLLDTGYRDTFWTTPFWTGFYGLIASPGKGYLFYNPISLAAMVGMVFFGRKNKPELGLIISLVLLNILFLAKFDSWHGGVCWGPRYLLQITPLFILPLACLLEVTPRSKIFNLLLAGLIGLSIMVQISGLSVNFARYQYRVHELSVEQYFQRVTFQWAYSPLIGQWGEVREVVGNLRDPQQRAAINKLVVEKRDDLSETIQMLSVNLPDFWFIYLDFIWGQVNDGGNPNL